jgi:hypothetical protein
MNYDLKLTVEEISLLKSALFDYKQRLDDNIISAKWYLERNADVDETKRVYEHIICSNKETINEVIYLMGKLNNIIPLTDKIFIKENQNETR